MMTELKVFISEHIKILVPSYDTVELKATVSSSSFSVEFFATVDGKKMQCFQMIDDGQFTEKNFNIFSKAIANYVRELPDFDNSGINRYTVILKW